MVKAMGYKAVQAQALTAPPYFFAILVILGIAWYSDKYQSRTKALLISYAIGMVGTIIIWPALHYSGTTAACYFALFLIVGGFNAQGPAVGALATNFRNPAKRAVAMGICGTIGQMIGGVGGAVRLHVFSQAISADSQNRTFSLQRKRPLTQPDSPSSRSPSFAVVFCPSRPTGGFSRGPTSAVMR